ncbi:MAG: hypothetical protein KDC44_24100, partial [Phaeodactylibacter sp.]|nr:hypothetical protein [Phaeodactylibacter sp.]
MFQKKLMLVSCLLCSLGLLVAQERIGLRIGNYSGSNGMALNPAQHVTSQVAWDVHLAGAGVFFENSYGYLENVSLLDLYRSRGTFDLYTRPILEGAPTSANPLYLDFPQGSNRTYYGDLNLDILGPGFMVKLKTGHSFGMFTRFRTAGSARISNSLGFYNYYFYPENKDLLVEPMRMGTMAWGELGFNYGYSWETQVGTFGFGVNLRYLQGFEAIYFENLEQLTLQKKNDQDIDIEELHARFGFTETNTSGEAFDLQRNGGGFGVDAGIMLTGDGQGDLYQWKFGAALIDIGSVRFFRNVQTHRVDVEDGLYLDGLPFQDLDSTDFLNAAVLEFSFQALQDSLESLSLNAFTMALPSALSIQGEYAITDHLMVHGLWVQSLPFSPIAVHR